jgi:chaperonin GroES
MAKTDLKLHPLEDRVVVRPTEEAETMRGGLYIPDSAKEKPTQGEVIAVGPGRLSDKGERLPIDIKAGDTVIYGKYSGTPFTIAGEEVMIIKASDVLAKLG